jgi:hypothetical protein
MSLGIKHIGPIALIGIPLVTGVLWLASGREVLTKHDKAVNVVVHDELFGDQRTETQLVPGPLLGYYVGLDLFVAISVITLAVAALVWWLKHRGLRQSGQGGFPL